MCNKKHNSALYLLSVANCIHAITNKSYDWLFFLSVVLTALVLLSDISEVIKRGRK